MKKILIAYYTKTNTSRDIAQHIASVLGKRTDNTTQVASIESDLVLEDYDMIILGAPIHGMKWAKEAQDYVKQHKRVLEEKPLALFQCSYLDGVTRPFFQKLLQKALRNYQKDLTVMDIGYFKGRVQDAFPPLARLLFGLEKDIPLDRYNPSEVESWAMNLAEKWE